MPEPQRIAFSLSNRRPVLQNNPEYDRLLLALRDEQPEALQDDEIAHLQTLLAPNFRTQNDPVADRARLKSAYQSTMERLLTPGRLEGLPVKRGGSEVAQTMGTLADLFVGPELGSGGPTRDAAAQRVRDRFAAMSPTERVLSGLTERPPTPRAVIPLRENAQTERPMPLTVGQMVVNAGLGALEALDQPPSKMPAGAPYTTPLRLLTASAAVPSALAGVAYDASGQGSVMADAPVVDPLQPADKQSTFSKAIAERGGGKGAQALGFLADLLTPDFTDVLTGGVPLTAMAGGLKNVNTGRKLLEEPLRLSAHGASFDDQVGTLLIGGNRAGIPKGRLLQSDYEHVGRMLEKYPEIADDLPYLHASEVSALSRMSDTDQGEFVRLKPETTRNELVQAAAKGGEVKRHWYNFSRAAIDHLYEDDAARLSTVAAALSPRTSVENGTLNAATFFENWREAGRPVDRDAVQAILDRSVQKAKAVKGKPPKEGTGVLPAWRNNTTASVQEALDDIVLSGPKVQSFRQNLTTKPFETAWGKIHPDDAITADAWKATAAAIEQSKLGGDATRVKVPELAGRRGENDTTPAYLRVSADTRRAGHGMSQYMDDMLPWSGSEIQETEWSYVKSLYELAKKLKMKAVDVVKQGLLTDSMIEGTPDLTLLARGRYGEQLARDPNKKARMANIVPGQFNKATPTSPIIKARQLEVAQIIDDTIRRRRMTTDFHAGRNKYVPESTIATSPQEVQVATDARMPALSAQEQRNILNATQDALGRDPIAVALQGGTNVIPSESGVGVFKSERNPLRATGSALEMDDAGNLKAKAIRDQNFASRFGGGMNMQKVVTWQATSFNPGLVRNVLHVTLSKPIKEPVLEGIIRRFPSTKFGIVDRGGSLEVVRFDGGFLTPADAEKLETYLETSGGLPTPKRFTKGAKEGQRKTSQVKLGTNIAPTDAYTTMGTNQKVGSQAVTGNMMGLKGVSYDLLTPEQQTALDGPRIKNIAKTILEQYRAAAERTGRSIRPDVENMLIIIRDGGATALREALDDPKQLLPVLAGLGVYNAIGRDTSDTSGAGRRDQ